MKPAPTEVGHPVAGRCGALALTELVTNNAAALLMFPIAVAVAATASFLTPIGYQTNTMVYGPRGYRFGDYARLGWMLTLAVLVVPLVGVGWVY